MKILYLVSGIGPPAGWGTEFIQKLIFELSKKGVQATIINPIYKHTHPRWKQWTKEQEKKFNVKIIPLEVPSLIKKHLILHFIITPFIVTWTVLKLLPKEKFDFIHEFSSTPIILFRAFLFKLFFKIPTIFTLSVYNNTFLGKFLWFKLFNFAKAYCISSKEIIDNLKDRGINSNKIFFAPPGIETNNFNTVINKSVARKILNLPQGEKIISFFGSLTDEKGISDLLAAVKRIDENLKKEILVAIFAVWKGSSNHKIWASKLTKLHYIKLFEKPAKIPLVIAASDLIVLPQRTGHGTTIPPISVLEVLASQTILLATNIVGNREIIKPPDILLPPKDPESLCKAIEKILQKNERVHKRNVNLKLYDTSHVTTNYLKIYHALLNQ